VEDTPVTGGLLLSPDVDLMPDHAFEAVQEVAFREDQRKRTASPAGTIT
jgi:hypothetical protein